MKKKLQKKLHFNKATVANLDNKEQSMIRGGWETDPMSGCPTGPDDTCNTYCGTCESECGTCITICEPHGCESIPLRECDTVHCQ